MAVLKEIWIENYKGQNEAVRIDWDNDLHHRIEIEGISPERVALSLKDAGAVILSDMRKGLI